MKFFNSGGVSIAYVDSLPESGQGDPILLIHGFASNYAVNWFNVLWFKTLNHAGYRVIAFDNRGHGESEKLYDPAAYTSSIMAGDARRLLDHLKIERADVMGYSMGARIASFLALEAPERVRSVILGGLGIRLVNGAALPLGIADAMEVLDKETLTDPMQRMFRFFAEQTKSDLKALAACIRGNRQSLDAEQVSAISQPVLIAVGTKDEVSGSARELAALIPHADVLDIPNRDHNLAVGDKVYKQGVVDFLARRP